VFSLDDHVIRACLAILRAVTRRAQCPTTGLRRSLGSSGKTSLDVAPRTHSSAIAGIPCPPCSGSMTSLSLNCARTPRPRRS
jgi:hypothetical protein